MVGLDRRLKLCVAVSLAHDDRFVITLNQARELYDRHHSNDQSGDEHEDAPPWAEHFFRLFEAQQNVPSASAQLAETRNERRMVVSGLTGRQAPLGSNHGRAPAQLRSETSRNVGTGRMRQMVVGDVDVEVMGDGAMDDLMDDLLVEGFDDTANKRPSCCRRTNNGDGVRRRNANIDFGAGRNDPAAGFHHVTRAFKSLDALQTLLHSPFLPHQSSLPPTLPSPSGHCFWMSWCLFFGVSQCSFFWVLR